MKELVVERTVEVKASPQQIWDAMVAVNDWPKWKSFIIRSRVMPPHQSLTAGSRFKMSLMAGGPAAAPVSAVVTEFQPPSRLAWTGGKAGVMQATHGFTFEDLGSGITRVVSRERFSGFLLPLFLRIATPDELGLLHEQWVQAIREKMEGKAEPLPAGGHSH